MGEAYLHPIHSATKGNKMNGKKILIAALSSTLLVGAAATATLAASGDDHATYKRHAQHVLRVLEEADRDLRVYSRMKFRRLRRVKQFPCARNQGELRPRIGRLPARIYSFSLRCAR